MKYSHMPLLALLLYAAPAQVLAGAQTNNQNTTPHSTPINESIHTPPKKTPLSPVKIMDKLFSLADNVISAVGLYRLGNAIYELYGHPFVAKQADDILTYSKSIEQRLNLRSNPKQLTFQCDQYVCTPLDIADITAKQAIATCDTTLYLPKPDHNYGEWKTWLSRIWKDSPPSINSTPLPKESFMSEWFGEGKKGIILPECEKNIRINLSWWQRIAAWLSSGATPASSIPECVIDCYMQPHHLAPQCHGPTYVREHCLGVTPATDTFKAVSGFADVAKTGFRYVSSMALQLVLPTAISTGLMYFSGYPTVFTPALQGLWEPALEAAKTLVIRGAVLPAAGLLQSYVNHRVHQHRSGIRTYEGIGVRGARFLLNWLNTAWSAGVSYNTAGLDLIDLHNLVKSAHTTLHFFWDVDPVAPKTMVNDKNSLENSRVPAEGLNNPYFFTPPTFAQSAIAPATDNQVTQRRLGNSEAAPPAVKGSTLQKSFVKAKLKEDDPNDYSIIR